MTKKYWSSRAIRLAAVQTALWCVYAAIPLAFHDSVITDPILDASFVFALSLLMVIRVNRSYERWWEARTLWGTLVNASRNLAVKIHVYARPDAGEAKSVHALISGFAYGLRDHLRDGAKLSRLTGFEADDADPDHVPSHLVSRLNTHFRSWVEGNRVTQHELRMLDLEARTFLEVAGACERIKNTPLPPALTWVTRLAVVGFLVMTPWTLEDEFGWMIIPIAGVAAFLVIVSNTIATALEHPFGTELSQLDLSDMSGAIESSTAEILGV